MVVDDKIKLPSDADFDHIRAARRLAEKQAELSGESAYVRQEEQYCRNPRRRKERHRQRAAAKGSVHQRWKRSDCPDDVCYWCGIEINELTDELDHIMPIGLHGPAEPYNEAHVCHNCNWTKLGKHPLVWLAQLVSA